MVRSRRGVQRRRRRCPVAAAGRRGGSHGACGRQHGRADRASCPEDESARQICHVATPIDARLTVRRGAPGAQPQQSAREPRRNTRSLAFNLEALRRMDACFRWHSR